MAWLKSALSRLKGGDQEGFRESVDQAYRAGEAVNVGQLTDAFHVSAAFAEKEVRAAALSVIWDEVARQYEAGGVDAKSITALAARLGRPQTEADLVLGEHASVVLAPLVKAFLADGQIDPSEDDAIRRELMRLGDIDLDAGTDQVLQRARDLWNAWNSDLHPVQAPILLGAAEHAVHVVHAEATEVRTRTTRVNYHGPSGRIRIAKGLSYNMGSMAVNTQSEAFEHSFGEGALVITNKRLLWVGTEKSITIKLSNIIRYDDYSNAICIYKGTGKPAMFRWMGDDRASTIKCIRAIEELR